MPLTPEAHHALYANESGVPLEAQLEAALAHNIASGLIVAEATSLASAAAVAVAEATGLRNKSPQIEELSPGIKELFLANYHTTQEVFASIDLELPSLADFELTGTNFKKLAAGYKTMAKLGLEPEVVFAPILPSEQWEQVFKTIENNLHDDTDKLNGGLWISEDAKNSWDKLQGTSNVVAINGQGWQVSVVPGTEKTPVLDIDHNFTYGNEESDAIEKLVETLQLNMNDDVTYEVEAAHPTIATYLTFQAIKKHMLQPLTDESTATWLDGEIVISSKVRSPVGLLSDSGQVHVILYGVTDRYNDLGARLTIYGTD